MQLQDRTDEFELSAEEFRLEDEMAVGDDGAEIKDCELPGEVLDEELMLLQSARYFHQAF